VSKGARWRVRCLLTGPRDLVRPSMRAAASFRSDESRQDESATVIDLVLDEGRRARRRQSRSIEQGTPATQVLALASVSPAPAGVTA